MKKFNRAIEQKKSFPTILLLLLLAITLVLLKFIAFNNKKSNEFERQAQPNTMAAGTTGQVPSQANTSTPSLAPSLPPTKIVEVPPPGQEDSCKKTSAAILQFIQHLEQEEFIKSYTQGEPLEALLDKLANQLLSNPPINEKETADIISVVKNLTHFFRILGSKDLFLLKDILSNEQATLEQQFAVFYQWSLLANECPSTAELKFRLPIASMYEYAAFFLDTLGGRSYLARRDAPLRVLTKYYSVLIIHQAAQRSLNRYNVNLPYHLDATLKEIANSDFLENQSSYLDTLRQIKSSQAK